MQREVGWGAQSTIACTAVGLTSKLVPVEVDHVLIAVSDLAAAARELEGRHGLGSIVGGHHPAWGTANRIIPLGDSYLELIAVIDATKADESVFGRWVAAAASTSGRPLGWAVRTQELDEVARRLNLTIQAGSRATPDGQMLRWRSAGVDHAAAEPSLPFFIEWAPDAQLPGQATIQHRAGAATITSLALSANPNRLAAWLGNHQLPIVVHAGIGAVTSIHISSSTGEIVLSSETGASA